MKAVIEAQQLSKQYADVTALDKINLSVKPGTILGLIGPNGAGKSTLLKAIFGLIDYDGKLEILGMNPRQHRVALLERMCFIADVAILPDWLRVKNAIQFVDGVHPRFDRDCCLNFLKKTHIPMDKKIGELSKGMVVQLHLALVMAIDADILVLDEPTLGLDILYRKEFYRQILDEYYHEQRTIIITTHQVEEIEAILTDMVMINNGKILLDASMDALQQRFLTITVSGDDAQKLQGLNPLSVQTRLGRSTFVFENVAEEILSPYGDVAPALMSDIFVAKIQQAERI